MISILARAMKLMVVHIELFIPRVSQPLKKHLLFQEKFEYETNPFN